MYLTHQQSNWLSSKGVVVIPQGTDDYRVISPVSDISLLSQEASAPAPRLPYWVLSSAFTSRVEGFAHSQLESIKDMAQLISDVSHEFFWGSWHPSIEKMAFDIAIGVDVDVPLEEHRRLEQFTGQTMHEVILGSPAVPGLPELAIDTGGWLALEGLVPMLHWLLGNYSAETVLPQIFAEAQV